MEEHINYFGDDIDIYKSNNQYKDSCALVIIQIGKYAGTLGKEFREKYNKINWSEIVSEDLTKLFLKRKLYYSGI